ncbi:MAG: YidC/Oxa1 family insertase periplasmic-domain containing protein [Planctomycetota bacterium]
MDARRFLWILVGVALATMVVMLVLQKTIKAPSPEQPGDAAAKDAPAMKAAPGAEPPKPSAPAARPETKPAVVTVPTPSATAPAPSATAPTQPLPKWSVPVQPVREVILGSVDQDTGYKFQVQLTSQGAAVKTLKLSEHFTTVADKRRWDKDPHTYPQALKDDPKLKGNYSLLNPVAFEGPTRHAFATRRVYFPAEPRDHRMLDVSGPRWRTGEVTTDDDGTQRVEFTALVQRDGKDHLRLVKTYTVRKDSYSVEVDLRAENLSGGEVEVVLTQFAATGVPREDVQRDQRYGPYGKYIKGELKVPKPPLAKAKGRTAGLAGSEDLGRSAGPDATVWAGVANKFFACLTYVKPAAESEALAAPAAQADYRLAVIDETARSRTFLSYVRLGPYRLAPGAAQDVNMDVFAGAKDRKLFEKNALYSKLDYKASLNFGDCFCVITPLVLGLMWLLETLGGLLHNYGLGIILLVAVVRLCLHPLTKKGQVSMMAMQKLQPQMEKLKEQYANDKQKLQAETMKLYKSAGFTPMLGCLPMLLQMPIWFALWRGLQATVALRHAPFLPFWITDLAAPDALIKFSEPLLGGYAFPMVGQIVSFNLLPILLGVAMFLQQKFSPQAAASAAGGQKASTQKQMMYFMTVFFLLIFYNMPSGLNLYIMTSTFAGVAEQYVIRKHIRERQAAEAAVETKVSMPGKRFRGQKPKKPKGPFRTM